MADWFEMKVNRFGDLNDIPQREEILTEIKIKLANMPPNEAAEITKDLDLTRLFSQLTSTDTEYVEQQCEAISILFKASKPGQILQRYTPEIYKLLEHEEPALKITALEELHRAASDANCLSELLTKLDLLVLVTELVAHKSLGLAKYAMRILKQIGETPEGLKVLYSGVLLRAIAKLLATSDVVRFRTYEVIVDISVFSTKGLEASVSSGLMQSLLDQLDNDDLIVQLNVLEILSSLALSRHGLNYLEQQGVLQKLSEQIAQAHELPLSVLVIPAIMKFFGNVAFLWTDEIFTRYPAVISALFAVIQSDDQTILAIALDTLGHIATHVKGKYALQNLGNEMSNALKRIAEVIQKMPSQLRVRGLSSLRRILFIPKAEQDNRILSLTKSWFDELCEKPLEMILSLSRQPFADIRLESLKLLAVIANQEWGQEYIANHPGLIEFLLDRNIESFKECKETKYEVLHNLSESAPNLFDAVTMQRLKKFLNDGVFFVEPDVEVAIEGAS